MHRDRSCCYEDHRGYLDHSWQYRNGSLVSQRLFAKTQYSFSDNPKNLQCDEPFKIHVKDVILKNGAEFTVVLTGKIFTMPGLPEVPSAEKINLDDFENIVGLF